MNPSQNRSPNQSQIIPPPIVDLVDDYADTPIIPMAPPKKSKKGLIIGLIIAGILLVSAGMVSAYVFWYSAPEKVVSDAIINSLKSKSVTYNGNVVIAGDNLKMSFDIDGKQAGAATGALNARLTITAGDRNYIVNGSGIIDKTGNLYYRANLKTVVPNITSALGLDSKQGASQAIDNFVEKLNNKWIKISNSELSDTNKDYATARKCISSLVDDKAAVGELTNLYKQQPFMTVGKNLGQSDGSVGYSISIDNNKFADFTKQLEQTDVYKTINRCDNKYSIDNISKFMGSGFDKLDNSTYELWVGNLDHQITKVAASGEVYGRKVSATILPVFNQAAEVTAPTDVVDLLQLRIYVQDLSRVIYGSTELPDIDFVKYLNI